jgi:hypothetical protein
MDKESREKHAWNNYLVVLAEHQMESYLYTRYVSHCETFIRRNKETRLKQYPKESASDYLSALIN